jgi:hypothetical protein
MWESIKPIIYHTLPNKFKNIVANTYSYHNKQTLPLSDNIKLNSGPQKPTKYLSRITNKNITITRETTRKRKKKITTPKTRKTPTLPNTRRITPNHTSHDKKTVLTCGDKEKKPSLKLTLLLDHPQTHQEKHNVYFYKNTIQIKTEYIHILELFKPYLNHTQTNNTNPPLSQLCINNQQSPHSHLFYAILITLAPTLTQYNQLIIENSTQWTITLLNKLINNPTPLSIEPHILQKFHLKNPHITKPLDSIQKEVYSLITTT